MHEFRGTRILVLDVVEIGNQDRMAPDDYGTKEKDFEISNGTEGMNPVKGVDDYRTEGVGGEVCVDGNQFRSRGREVTV